MKTAMTKGRIASAYIRYRCSERRLVGEATPFLYMAENEGFEFLIDDGSNFRGNVMPRAVV